MIRHGRQRYLHINNILSIVGIPIEQFYTWILRPERALHIIKQVEDTFYEVEGISYIVSVYGSESQQQTWHIYTERNNLRRELTGSEKVRVASSQSFCCNICKQLLDDTFEVDHITEFCMGNRVNNPDRISNLQALCVSCHKTKTKNDYLRFNPLFSNETRKQSSKINKTNNHGVFSKYFYQS